jgi:hypothetical protein
MTSTRCSVGRSAQRCGVCSALCVLRCASPQACVTPSLVRTIDVQTVISEKQMVLVPLHTSMHWALAVVHVVDGEILYFDSAGDAKSRDARLPTSLKVLHALSPWSRRCLLLTHSHRHTHTHRRLSLARAHHHTRWQHRCPFPLPPSLPPSLYAARRCKRRLLMVSLSLSFVLCPLSFVLCPLSFVLCPLSFVLCPLSFVLCPLSFVLCPLSLLLLATYLAACCSRCYRTGCATS